MARVRIPGGRLAAEQYLALDGFASRFANGTLRVTTRQTIQFHGILKGNLPGIIHAINDELLTTMAACGEVVRHVPATPAPIKDRAHETPNRETSRLSAATLPTKPDYPQHVSRDGRENGSQTRE